VNEPKSCRLVVTFDLDYDPRDWPDPESEIQDGTHLLPNIACFLGIVADPMNGDEGAGYQITNPTVYTMRGFFEDIQDRIPE